jgi:acyl transferase domain-containing protein/thioesterase domain-containing protein
MTSMEDNNTGIAIIGMAGRFPGAKSVSELWRNLLAGTESVRRYSNEELARSDVSASLLGRAEYVPAGADLEDADAFDAEFFGVPGHEARLMDPQQRVFLECAWAALEDAGHLPGQGEFRVGVFGSASMSSYLVNVLARSGMADFGTVNYPVLLGNDKDFLATRVSYKLGLTGPSMTVQTACSSSLAAVHLASQALLSGECDVALAGGVSITFPQGTGYLHQQGGILSPDGRCRPFDASAAGTIKGNGCAVVVLRRLDDAIAAGDYVYAVLRATAINNDGSDKVGYSAPSPAGQAEVIRDALDVAAVPACDVGYVEAHGTGTALGDPIEVRALASAHGDAPPERCYLGSIKANVGHLDAAAGVTGLLKTALVLRDQVVPPQPNFTAANPQLGLDRLWYEVPQRIVRPAQPIRAAAVSSFGLGGTNVHAVLVSAPPDERPAPPPGLYVALLSAIDDEALREYAVRLHDGLVENPRLRIDDIVFTLATGRTALGARVGFSVESVSELRDCLDAFVKGTGDHGDHGVVRRWIGGQDTVEEVGDISGARRVPLPTHPFRRVRHWVDAPAREPSRSSSSTDGQSDGDLLARVQAVITGRLGCPVNPGDDIHDLGVDSLMAVEIVSALRDEFGVKLALEAVNDAPTPLAIASLIRPSVEGSAADQAERPSQQSPNRGPAESSAVLSGSAQYARFRHLITRVSGKDDDAGNVFLVHPAGGTTICYAELARHASTKHSIYGIAFPTEAASEFPSIRDLARLYLALVRDRQQHGPYTLGGYSFGGNVAFEMGLLLEEAGEPVERVIMFDSHPPEAYVGGHADDRGFLDAFPILLRAILPKVEVPTDFTAASVRAALEAIRLPRWSDGMLEELECFFAVWRHNHSALKRYYPDVRLRADVTLLAASEQESEEITERLAIRRVPKHAWRNHMLGRLELVSVPGDHYSMFRDHEHLRTLAARYSCLFESGAFAGDCARADAVG